MGIGCPGLRRQKENSLPVLNMIVVGFSRAGKTTLINRLATDREESSLADASVGKMELDIGSFVLQKKLKVVTFEVASSAVKSWRFYYPNAHILLVVVDCQRLREDSEHHGKQIRQALHEMDDIAPLHCKLILVFNKMDTVCLPEAAAELSLFESLGNLRHEISTIRCSALLDENIDKLSQTICNFSLTPCF